MEKIATRGFLSQQEIVLKRTQTATDFRALYFPVHFKGARSESQHILISSLEFQSKGKNGSIKVRLFDSNDNEISLEGSDNGSFSVDRAGGYRERALASAFDNVMAYNVTSTPSDPEYTSFLMRQPGVIEGLGDIRFPGDLGLTPIDPTPPPPPPPPDRERVDYFVELNPAIHPEGIWRAEFHNLDEQVDRIFINTVDYPTAVVEVEQTHLSFDLFRNPFCELMKLINLSVKIDNGTAEIRLRDEFAELIGIDQKLSFSVPGALKDISLAGTSLSIGQGSIPGTATITLAIEFEDGGPDEVAIPFLPDVDLENLAGSLSLHIGRAYEFEPHAVHYKRNGFDTPWPVHAWAKFSVEDVHVSTWGKILGFIFGQDVNEKVQNFADGLTLYFNTELIPKYRSYLVDVLQFLAQHNHVVHAVSSDQNGLIVHHHRDPNTVVIEPQGELGRVSTRSVTLGALSRRFAGLPQPTLSQTFARRAAIASPNPATREEGSSSPPLFNTVSLADLSDRLDSLGTLATEIPPERKPIEHLVVLTLENRSFDHMLGYLKLKQGHASNGLEPNMSNSSMTNPAYKHLVHHLDRTVDIRSPNHKHEPVLSQIANGKMSGFIDSYELYDLLPDIGQRVSDVMGYYDETQVSFFQFAANEYAICDRWFCSHPGPTQPNRFATVCGVIPELSNYKLDDERLGYTTLPTIFDLLTSIGVSWNYVEHDLGFIRTFDRYRTDTQRVITYRKFKERLAQGQLSSVTYIDPSFVDVPPSFNANDDHAPTDILAGQRLCADLYNALHANPEIWTKTMLIITYDEHGGFFDHVSPLDSRFNEIPKIHPDSPNMYGPRVPTLVLSPWVRRGSTFSEEYDHTSLIRTIMKLFCPQRFLDRQLFGPRTDKANDLVGKVRASARGNTPSFSVTIGVPRSPDIRFHDQGMREDFHYMMQRLGLSSRQRERLLG